MDPLTSYTDNLPEKSAEDEDEDSGGGGQRVQCAQHRDFYLRGFSSPLFHAHTHNPIFSCVDCLSRSSRCRIRSYASAPKVESSIQNASRALGCHKSSTILGSRPRSRLSSKHCTSSTLIGAGRQSIVQLAIVL
eukprot:scaffold159755_cov32-Tisochrysis_lutea.AAC.3